MLTVVAALMALRQASAPEVLDAWTTGLWNAGLIRFAFQAMFMLVLGHVLALAPPVLRALHKAIDWIVKSPINAPAKVALLSMVMGWVNWGLGLISGAILVRGVMDRRRREGKGSPLASVSLGVLGAAGYTGLLVWHGGLGGSAPLKAAESGHLGTLVPNVSWLDELPNALTLSETALTGWSQAVTWTVISVVVLTFVWLGRRIQGGVPMNCRQMPSRSSKEIEDDDVRGGLAQWAGRIVEWLTSWGRCVWEVHGLGVSLDRCPSCRLSRPIGSTWFFWGRHCLHTVKSRGCCVHSTRPFQEHPASWCSFLCTSASWGWSLELGWGRGWPRHW